MTVPTQADHDALLAAFLADPGDDLPRLAYADWLEESGRAEHAEFVRLQLATADEPQKAGMGYRLWERLHERERELLLRHCLEWAPRLLPANSWEVILSEKWAYGRTPAVLFRRGFVAEAACSLADWLEHGPALAKAHPLERVTLADRRPHFNGYGYAWFLGGRPSPSAVVPEAAELPHDIFLRLPEAWTAGIVRGCYVAYDTPARARDVLSSACVLWARQ